MIRSRPKRARFPAVAFFLPTINNNKQLILTFSTQSIFLSVWTQVDIDCLFHSFNNTRHERNLHNCFRGAHDMFLALLFFFGKERTDDLSDNIDNRGHVCHIVKTCDESSQPCLFVSKNFEQQSLHQFKKKKQLTHLLHSRQHRSSTLLNSCLSLKKKRSKNFSDDEDHSEHVCQIAETCGEPSRPCLFNELGFRSAISFSTWGKDKRHTYEVSLRSTHSPFATAQIIILNLRQLRKKGKMTNLWSQSSLQLLHSRQHRFSSLQHQHAGSLLQLRNKENLTRLWSQDWREIYTFFFHNNSCWIFVNRERKENRHIYEVSQVCNCSIHDSRDPQAFTSSCSWRYSPSIRYFNPLFLSLPSFIDSHNVVATEENIAQGYLLIQTTSWAAWKGRETQSMYPLYHKERCGNATRME